MPDTKTFFSSTIERIQNPLAPLIFQDAYSVLDRLAKMLSSHADEETVNGHVDAFLKGFGLSDEELNKLSCDPNFAMALCGLLTQSLVGIVSKR